MRAPALLCLLCLLAFCDPTCGGGDKVKTLTEQNFDQIINTAPFALVEFFAPWPALNARERWARWPGRRRGGPAPPAASIHQPAAAVAFD